MSGYMAGGFGGLMWLFWIAVLVVAGLVIYRAASWRNDSQRTGNDSPEEILKRRYAGGEIGRDDYERMLADLRR